MYPIVKQDYSRLNNMKRSSKAQYLKRTQNVAFEFCHFQLTFIHSRCKRSSHFARNVELDSFCDFQTTCKTKR